MKHLKHLEMNILMKLKMSMQIWSFHFSSKQIYIIQPVRTTRVQWNESTCYFFSDFLLDDNSGNVWKIQVWSILDKTGPKWPKNEVFAILFIISFWRLFGINSNKTYRTATTFLFRTHARQKSCIQGFTGLKVFPSKISQMVY